MFDSVAPEKLLPKRIKVFSLACLVLVAFNKLVLSKFGIPNFELIIPALVVAGGFSIAISGDRSPLALCYGAAAVLTIGLLDVLGWGLNPIYAFTWPGFLMVWLLAIRRRLPVFDRFGRLLRRATITAALAILAFDIWTAFGAWVLWYPKTLFGLAMTYLLQIPFTLYHLASLVFVPPLVGLGKVLVRVKVPATVAAPIAVKAKTSQR
ncbi:MAG: hypothetical protein NZ934_01965 [Hadesarchaea archaeon]|nr:hypothetical protein [Hadesarchaea archaeon]